MASEFDLLFPAFRAGFADGINPFGSATVLIFLIFISILGHTSKVIFLLGSLFIFISGGIHFISVMGVFDGYLTMPSFLNYVRILYLALAVICIFLGVVNISDWWRYNSRLDIGCFRLKLPVFFCDNKKKHGASKWKKVLVCILIFVLTLLVSGLITLMGVTYPKSEYIFIVHSFMMSGGGRGFVYRSFFLYSFAMVLPIIIAWLTILGLVVKKKRGITAILYYKGISSALFLSTGIGLGYYFLK